MYVCMYVCMYVYMYVCQRHSAQRIANLKVYIANSNNMFTNSKAGRRRLNSPRLSHYAVCIILVTKFSSKFSSSNFQVYIIFKNLKIMSKYRNLP